MSKERTVEPRLDDRIKYSEDSLIGLDVLVGYALRPGVKLWFKLVLFRV